MTEQQYLKTYRRQLQRELDSMGYSQPARTLLETKDINSQIPAIAISLALVGTLLASLFLSQAV